MKKPTSWLALVLFAVGCGPPLASGDDHSEGESTTDSTTSPIETSEPSETSGATDIDTTDDGETETTDDGGTTSLSGGFIPEGDIIEPNTCDPFLQDCAPGTKCVPYSPWEGTWDFFMCVPVQGDHAPGEQCHYSGTTDSLDDCDETSFCWNVTEINGELLGVCTPFCTGTADEPECPEGSSCLISSSFSPALCVSTCDPLLQDCGEGLACYWANNGFNCVFTMQGIPSGEPCGFINDCAQGNGCISADVLPMCLGSACCTPFCDVELGNPPCAVLPGTVCVPFFEENMAPPGYENVGVCILP